MCVLQTTRQNHNLSECTTPLLYTERQEGVVVFPTQSGVSRNAKRFDTGGLACYIEHETDTTGQWLQTQTQCDANEVWRVTLSPAGFRSLHTEKHAIPFSQHQSFRRSLHHFFRDFYCLCYRYRSIRLGLAYHLQSTLLCWAACYQRTNQISGRFDVAGKDFRKPELCLFPGSKLKRPFLEPQLTTGFAFADMFDGLYAICSPHYGL